MRHIGALRGTVRRYVVKVIEAGCVDLDVLGCGKIDNGTREVDDRAMMSTHSRLSDGR